jgi:hypothetical protein
MGRVTAHPERGKLMVPARLAAVSYPTSRCVRAKDQPGLPAAFSIPTGRYPTCRHAAAGPGHLPAAVRPGVNLDIQTEIKILPALSCAATLTPNLNLTLMLA